MYRSNSKYNKLAEMIEERGDQSLGLPLFEQTTTYKNLPKWIADGSGVKAEVYERIKKHISTTADLILVMEALLTNGGNATDYEIEQLTGLPINVITARRNDWMELGVVSSKVDWQNSTDEKKVPIKRKGKSNIKVTVWFVDFKKLQELLYYN